MQNIGEESGDQRVGERVHENRYQVQLQKAAEHDGMIPAQSNGNSGF